MYLKLKFFNLEDIQFGFSIIFKGRETIRKYKTYIKLSFSIRIYFDFWKKRFWIAFSKREKSEMS